MLHRVYSVVDSSRRNLCVRIQHMKTPSSLFAEDIAYNRNMRTLCPSYIVKADALGVELIPDTESNLWCYRPVILDDKGVETVRYAPDPCEFKHSVDQIKAMIDEAYTIAERSSL
jgi:hypothetical protein